MERYTRWLMAGYLFLLLAGCTDKPDEEKGIFRLEKTPERWILRDPEQQPFVILSVNHAHTLENGKYNPLIEDQFGGPDEAGRHFADLIRSGGFNAAGYKPYHTMMDHIPFVHGEHFVECNFWRSETDFSYDDVFAAEWKKEVEDLVRDNCAAAKDNPNLIGYVFTDTPRWGLDKARMLRGTDWVSYMRELPDTAPGKNSYVDYLLEQYGNDPDILQSRYGITGNDPEKVSSHDFTGITLDDPGVREDDLEFLRLIARSYYETIVGAYKKYDPDHLLFGDKFKLYDHPDCVLEEAARFMDVLSFQPGQGAYGMPRTADDAPLTENHFSHLEELDRIHEKTGKPVYICDHHLSFHTEAYPTTLWYQYPEVASQAEAYDRYLREALSRPYIIGYGRCQFHTVIIRGIAKQGIMGTDGTPFTDHLQAVSKTNHEVLKQIYAAVD